jgi:hypothetical protein
MASRRLLLDKSLRTIGRGILFEQAVGGRCDLDLQGVRTAPSLAAGSAAALLAHCETGFAPAGGTRCRVPPDSPMQPIVPRGAYRDTRWLTFIL